MDRLLPSATSASATRRWLRALIPLCALAVLVVGGAARAQTYPGTLSNTATVAPPAGVSDPDSGNNSSTDQNTLQAQADLGISKTILTPVPARAGSEVRYRIVLSNAGPSVAAGVTVVDTVPPQLQNVSWTCAATGAASSCGSAAGSGNLSTLVTLAPSELITLDVRGTAPAITPATIAANTASLTLPSGVSDPSPGNNSSTTAAIQVQPPTLVANADTFGPVNGHAGAASVGSVLTNDTFDGSAATPALVVVTPVPAQNGVSIAEDGTVTVASNTPAGTVNLPYTVCQRGNPGNCQSSTVAVQVVAAAIVANPDSVGPVVSGNAVQPNVGNVLVNDTFDGVAATTATVQLNATPSGPVSIGADGSISVAANAAAGSYPVSYTICDRLNAGNCSTAVATVTVVAPPPLVDAVDDVLSPAPGTSGVIGNALTNDTLGGQPATTATVTVTAVTQGPLTLSGTGEITLAANTAAGSYQLSYQICQTGNAGNCDSATVTVHVAAPSVVALADSTGPVVAGVARTNIGNVLANDTYNGGQATTANVSLAPVSDQGITINGDGSIDVDATATVGVHTLNYTICSRLAPGSCSTAQLSVRVNAAPPVVDAVDDVITPALGASGAIGNVLGNDTIGGQAATTTTVSVTANSQAPLSVAADGTISLLAGTAAGSYQLSYQICQTGNAGNCDTATITVHVPAPPVLVANADSAGPVQAGVARTDIGNVLANDTYNGGPAVATTNVTLAPVSADGIRINADGSIDVDAAVTAGTKILTYTICSVVSSSTCATAQLSVQVNAAPPLVDAVDDVITPALNAASPIGNVLVNDTIAGQAATTATVTVAVTSAGPLSVAADGSIGLAAGTPAGTYQLSYQICQAGGTSNCDSATVTVHVPAAPVLVANADSAGPVQAGISHPNIGNVLPNDTVDGAVASTATVTVRQDTGAPGIGIDGAGNISVDAAVAAGTYVAQYTICSRLDPATCASAQLTVQVTAAAPTVDAIDDVTTVVVGSSGTVGNVLDNDLIGGATPTPSTVQVTSTPQGPLSVDGNGNLLLASGAAAGSYSVGYQICDIADAGNCDSATATVQVTAPLVQANPDTLGPATAGVASNNIGNVLANDTYNGGAAVAGGNVVLAPVSAQGISINADGSVDVAASATAGVRTLDYVICAAISASTCSTAQLTAQIAAAPPVVDAVDDVLTPAPGASGLVGNVLTNDTLGGQPASTATVTLAAVTQGPLALSATGDVTLAPGTAAGSYQLTYRICQSGDAGNCDTATVTVQVSTPAVQANVDTIGPVIAGVARTNIGNVLGNDTYNGGPAVAATNVSLAPVSAQGITVNSDGSVDVDATLAAGSRTISYTICSVVDPGICSTAQLTVQAVTAPLPIDAVNDVIAVDAGASGNIGNVLANDLIGTSTPSAATVLLTAVPQGPLSLDADGNVVLAAATAPGSYTLTYQICESAYPDNCDVAVLTVQVRAPAIVANADSAGPVTAGTAYVNVGNVLANDTYNGALATPANVTLTQLSGGPDIIIGSDGRIDVASTATAGPHTARYRICASGGTTTCAEADLNVQVAAAPATVDAIDDLYTPASNAGGVVGNVLTNDTLGGVAVQAGQVVVSANSEAPLSVDSAGDVTLAPGAAADTYRLTYQLCAAGNAGNCDSATITVRVPPGVLVAGNDSVTVVASASAQAAVLNVLANDSLNGAPATVGNVSLNPASNGPVSINADGSVDVAANPAPGTYALTYRICEVLNATNCADATVTVIVSAAPVVVTAVADSFGPVTGNLGGANVGNVLGNDLIGGVAATVSNAQVTPGGAGPLQVKADGSVDVAPGTGSGDYTLTYTVCERDTPGNCGTALVTVQVRPAVIAANDDITAPVDGLNGGINIGNVLNNDTLGGDPATPAAVTLVPITQGGVTINADGSVDIAPNTPQGTVQITYQICETINTDNCDIAIARITVSGAALNALADSAGPVPGNVVATNVVNVLTNDSINGVGATTDNVALSQLSGGPAISIQANGSVDVAAGLAAGSYVARYRICQPLNPGNCAEADVTIGVAAPPISAGADNLGPVDAATASVQAGNVLNNDLVGSQPATPGTVTLTQTGGDAGVSIDPATGAVTVAAGTAVGTHTATYQICEQRNPGNCASGTVNVVVAAAPVTIEAIDDRFDAVAATTGARNIGNVLTNDTLHGVAATTAGVVVIAASNAQLSVDVAGSVDVAAGTPVGLYTLAYRICETSNTTNCDSAIVTVSVVSAVLVANDDTAGPFSSAVGANHGGNLLFNDTLNGMPATTANVAVTVSTQGPVTINSDGTVSVPAGTAAGSYPATYRVCELAYPGNCAEASVSVVISSAPVVVNAMRDTFGPVASGVGGTNIGNVLANDEVNGAPATLSAVAVAAQYQAPVRLNADGSVDVDSTAVAGTYTLTYALCELADASNCDTTQLTINVVGATLLANPDSFGPIDGAVGSANLGNVLGNDTVNGQPATTASISLAETVSGPLRVGSDGHVELAPGTAPGTYVLVYQICGAINAANCSSAGVTVTVVSGSATVDAIDDVFGPVSGASGGTNVGNVLTNDLANGTQATITTVTVTPASNGPLTVNANGSVDVAGNTRVGSYSINYQLCVIGSTTDCDTATVTVNVVAASIIANNDTLGPALPGTYVSGNVLANDSLNGAGATLDLVSLTTVTSGPLTVENDGRVLVAVNASPGAYSIRYRICERLNAGSCAEADAQVTVAAAPGVVTAADDGFGPVARGSNGVGNVLSNDTVGSAQATTSNVVLTPVSNAALSVAADGTVNVLPGAPTGTQTLTYTICEIANPGNCASGVLSVQVRDAVLAANDDAMGPVNGITGARDIGNVLDNDTVDGTRAGTGRVSVTSSPGGPITINADGTVSVAPNSAAGDYTASYRICELGNANNCVSAVVRVQIAAGATTIAANADNFGPVSGATGSNNVGNVLSNDRIDGAVASPANVTLTATNTAALSIDAQGVLHLAAGTVAGTYTIQYTICDTNDGSRCAIATAGVTVAAAAIATTADVFGPLDGTAGGSNLGNVLANDRLDGNVPAAGTVTVTSTAVSPLGIDADGNLSVTPGTPAGTYSAQYTVCERLNPGNCGSAQITVNVVASAPILANPDSIGPVAAGPNVGNVLANDTVNGGPAAGLATLAPVSSGPLSIAADGAVSVTAGTPAGSYGITYQICVTANPAQCAQATVQVAVAAGALLAQDDTLGPVGSGGGSPGNVLANDTLGGMPVDATLVSLTPVSSGPLSIDANGTITLASGAATGTYTLTYTVCERSNPSNCDSAVLRVSVQAAVLVAADDTAGPLDGTAGAPNVVNVLANDRYNGTPANASNVSLAPVTQGPLSVAADGQLSLAPGTPAGTYTLRYRVCDLTAPAVCAEATVTVSVGATALTASDDAVQTAQATALTIAVLANDVQGGTQVNAGNLTITQVTAPANGTAVSDGQGAVIYTPNPAFTGTDSFQYTACERSNPSNCATATVTVTVAPNQIDIVADVVEITSPEPVQIDVLANDITTGAPLDPSSLSIVVAPEHGSVQCNAQGICTLTPDAGYNGQDRFTYRVCDTSAPQPRCGTGTVTVTISGNTLVARLLKSVANPMIKIGGLARFTVRAENTSDLPITNAMLINGIPAGFSYVAQPIVVTHDNGAGGVPGAGAPGDEALVSTNPLIISGIDIPPGGSATYSFYLRAGASVLGGMYESDAILMTTDGVALTNEASAQVMLEVDPTESESLIVGSVFADDNGNGVQDKGEHGLPGVRVGSVEGLVTETDGYGRYHLVGIAPSSSTRGSNFILKVDAATLPPGASFTTPNPRVRRITAGLPTRFDFGVKLPPGALAAAAPAATPGHLQVGAALFDAGTAQLRTQHAGALDGMAKGLQGAPGTVIVLAGEVDDAVWLQRALALRQALAARLPADSVEALRFQREGTPLPALGGRALQPGSSFFLPASVSLDPARASLLQVMGEALARGEIDRVVLPADPATPAALQGQRRQLLTEAINAQVPEPMRTRWQLTQEDLPPSEAGSERGGGAPTP